MFLEIFRFTCSFEFDDISIADVESKSTNADVVNTTNNDFLAFENTSELSDMEEIDEDECSPP